MIGFGVPFGPKMPPRERACDRYDDALANVLSVNSPQLFEVHSEAVLTAWRYRASLPPTASSAWRSRLEAFGATDAVLAANIAGFRPGLLLAQIPTSGIIFGACNCLLGLSPCNCMAFDMRMSP